MASTRPPPRPRPQRTPSSTTSVTASTSTSTTTCPICLEPFPSDAVSLPCRHRYCAECLGGHVKARIDEAPAAGVKCPTPRCGRELSQELILRHAGDRAERYSRQLLTALVRTDPHLVRCPHANCDAVVTFDATRESADAMACPRFDCPACGGSLCRCCGEQWHPAFSRCTAYYNYHWKDAEVPLWQRLAISVYSSVVHGLSDWIDMRAFDFWALFHPVRRCPNCFVRVEKNGGCPQMRCTQCNTSYRWERFRNVM